jgi:hypothetical protein
VEQRKRSLYSSKITGWTAEELLFDYRQKKKYFLISKTFTPHPVPTQNSIQW